MNDLHLSTSTKRLVEAAKADVPNSAVRAKMWAGVSGMVGGAAAAGASGTAASAVWAGSAGATKVLAIGGLFGGALTVGLAAALLQIGSAPTPPPGAPFNQAAGAHPAMPAIVRAAVIEPNAVAVVEKAAVVEKVETAPAQSSEVAAIGAVHEPAPRVHRHAKLATREDSLAREASLVAQARAALAVGDPQSALRAIREARALPSKQLVPEELAVEEQTLRALGRNDEANGINVMLRLQYPESALAP